MVEAPPHRSDEGAEIPHAKSFHSVQCASKDIIDAWKEGNAGRNKSHLWFDRSLRSLQGSFCVLRYYLRSCTDTVFVSKECLEAVPI